MKKEVRGGWRELRKEQRHDAGTSRNEGGWDGENVIGFGRKRKAQDVLTWEIEGMGPPRKSGRG